MIEVGEQVGEIILQDHTLILISTLLKIMDIIINLYLIL